jgi:nitroimidazol reductase NimA-like FMN-containing flavoprotein (pyridoxamine 5'-phosphate oxidase superfamily)
MGTKTMPQEGLVLYRRANRQYVAMSRKEVWGFLRTQHRVYLGFAMMNGYPHVTPIWFVIAGERVYMRAQDYKVKVGLAAKGKACVVIDDGDKYRELRGVVMWGRSRIVSQRKLVERVAELFEAKYSERQWKADEMPEEWVKDRAKERRAYIEFVPEKVDSWDNGKLQRVAGVTSGSRARPQTLLGRSRAAPR